MGRVPDQPGIAHLFTLAHGPWGPETAWRGEWAPSVWRLKRDMLGASSARGGDRATDFILLLEFPRTSTRSEFS